MAFWRSKRDVAVEAGTVFCRSERGKVLETARVLSVAPDRGGIPHVRFLLRKERIGDSGREEPRTLALERFRVMYPDHVAGASSAAE